MDSGRPAIQTLSKAATAFFADFDARLILEELNDAIVAADDGNRIAYLNPAAERLLGWPRSELVGRPLTTIVPARFRDAHLDGFTRYVRTRTSPLMGRPIQVPAVRRDGSEVEVELTISAFPLPEGELLIGALRDLTKLVELERQLSSASYLRATTEVAVRLGLAGRWVTLDEAAPEILSAIGDTLGWKVGSVLAVDQDRGVLRCVDTWLGEGTAAPNLLALTRERTWAPGEGLPGRVWASGEATWIVDVMIDVNVQRWTAAAADGLHAAFAFPIIGDGGVLGVVEFFNHQPVVPEHGLLHTMNTIGIYVGRFLEARRMEQEVQARYAFLARASTVLDASLDYETTLRRVARLTVPYLADTCVVDLVEDNGIRAVAIACADPAKEGLIRELRARYSPTPERPSPGMRAIADGDVHVYREMRELWSTTAIDQEHSRLMAELDIHAGMSIPLVAHGHTLGAIALGVTGRRPELSESEQSLARDLARRVALAVDNARLFAERTQAVRRLHEALVPADLPAVPGMDLGARHTPARDATLFGGDFYHAFDTGDGSWGVVIGDANGRGVEPAVLTLLARTTIQTAAMHEPRPSRLLATANAVLLERMPQDRYSTVAYVRLTPTERGAQLTVALAGHPQPIVVRSDGSTEPVGRFGSILGAFPDVDVDEEVVQLGPGDAMVLYTDGVIDRRGDNRFLEQHPLRELLSSCSHLSADELAGVVARSALQQQGAAARDDLAVLVLKVPA